ncbi:MAG: hypothetical protein F7C32_03695, partial [Desulfurococcales archaeon]|nr:hypothetical protein [Desulfurococcales archaeon]
MKHSSFTILILIFLSLPSTSILPMVEGSTTLSFCPGNYVVSYQNTTLNVSDITILRVQDPTEVVVSPPGLPLPKVPPGEYMVKLVNSSILIVYPSTVDGCSLEPPHINVGNEAVMVSLECVTDILYVGIGHIDTNSSQALPLYRYM